MSKAEKLFDAITDVRTDLIEEAQEYRFQRRSPAWRRFANIAACLVLVVGVAFFFTFGRGMGGSDSAMDNAGDSSTSNGAPPPMDGAAGESVGGDDGYDAGQTPADQQWHEGLVLPLTIENGEGLTVSRELRLTTGEMLAVEDVYTITAAEERQITLLYPVAARASAYSGVVITADGEEVEQEILQVDAGLDQLDPSNAMSHVEPDEVTGDGSWIFWARASVTISAGETVEVCIRYEKPITASVEIDLTDGSLWDAMQSVILDGREIALPDEGNIILDVN